MTNSKKWLFVLIVTAIACFFIFDLNDSLNLSYLKEQHTGINDFNAVHPLLSRLIFFFTYVVVTALSLPGAAIMTLAGGAVFGLWTGTLIISFASTIGATLAFLASRFLFRDSVGRRFPSQVKAVDRGMDEDGGFYLFTLRLVPAFPFFLINLLMGLTTVKTWTFYWVSQIGMLAGTLVYVNAGTQLAKLDSLSGILSPGLLVSFAILGIFPLLAKKTLVMIKARRALEKYPRPEKYDRNLVVIGAGAAGLVSAYIAAAVKARVTLIEKHKMGGDCLNTGCVPSKALIRSAKFVSQVKRAREFGIQSAHAEFEFYEIMQRVQEVIRKVEPHDSVERYTQLGVECLHGEARITSPFTVEVNGTKLTTRSIIIASGARPFVPPIEGIENIEYHTSDTIWEVRKLPRRLLVMGGGPIGCELVQAFQRLGSRVTQVEMQSRILVREDPEVSETVTRRLRTEGVDIRLNHKALSVVEGQGGKQLICEVTEKGIGHEIGIGFDVLLVAVGRIANTAGFGLEELGIGLTQQGTIETDAYLQTLYPNIYACGDAAGPYQFTHTAAHQAWYASVNSLFGEVKKFAADYSVIPWVTFTDPEVARVGLNEREADEQKVGYELSRFDLSDLDRAITDQEAHGFIKVLTVPGSDRILGVTIVGEHAGELIAEFVLAMRHKLGLKRILGTIHVYPTFSEANKYVAGNWKRAHTPGKLLEWVERYLRWRRGTTDR